MGFVNSVCKFGGFMSRAQYWGAICLYVFVPALCMIIMSMLAGMYDFRTNTIVLYLPSSDNIPSLFVWFLAIYEVFALTYGVFSIMAKRLRDISITPLMGLLYFIPPLTPFAVLLFGMFPTNVNSYER